MKITLNNHNNDNNNDNNNKYHDKNIHEAINAGVLLPIVVTLIH